MKCEVTINERDMDSVVVKIRKPSGKLIEIHLEQETRHAKYSDREHTQYQCAQMDKWKKGKA